VKKRNGLRTDFFPLLLCLLCAGCVHDSTTAQRDNSFLPYAGAKVGDAGLREFLIARSGVLVVGKQLVVADSGAGNRSPSIHGQISGVGTAAAIDRRGYFLTAAHCVKNGPVWLLFPGNGGVEARLVRVVWRGDRSKNQPDLAVLAVSPPLQDVFEWTPACTNGDSVVAVGISPVSARLIKTQCMAGKVLSVAAEENAVSRHTTISHSAPLRRGDSGGPLATADGRLIGINVSFEAGLQWKSLSLEPLSGEAQRPDIKWLRQTIEHDAVQQSGVTTNPPGVKP
jgi:S1-C subfamily serine protease